jgi:hypothetical protein
MCRRRFHIEGLSDLRSPSPVAQGRLKIWQALYTAPSHAKSTGLFWKKQNFKTETEKREIRTSGLWKLFSRLDSNFQKREGLCHTDRSLAKKHPVLRNIEAWERPQNTKEKMDPNSQKEISS